MRQQANDNDDGERGEDNDDDGSDSDEEFGGAQRKALKKAQELCKKKKFVHLGMFWNSADTGYKSRQPKQKLELSKKVVKSKELYSSPQTWFEFSLLFHRMMVMYCKMFPDQLEGFAEYFAILLQRKNLHMASDAALIEYDSRVREQFSGTWDWFKFNQQIWDVTVREYPDENVKETPGKSSKAPQVPKNNNNFVKPPQKHSSKYRTTNGRCHSWAEGRPCRFHRDDPQGCKFAHWCIDKKCQDDGSVNHKPNDCPNK